MVIWCTLLLRWKNTSAPAPASELLKQPYLSVKRFNPTIPAFARDKQEITIKQQRDAVVMLKWKRGIGMLTINIKSQIYTVDEDGASETRKFILPTAELISLCIGYEFCIHTRTK